MVQVAGFIYTPRDGEDKSGTMFKYHLLTSANGIDWTEAPTDREFSNIVNNPIEQRVFFNTPINARFVKIECLQEIEDRDYISIGEFTIFTPVK
jgi:alpha-L-fucosidase